MTMYRWWATLVEEPCVRVSERLQEGGHGRGEPPGGLRADHEVKGRALLARGLQPDAGGADSLDEPKDDGVGPRVLVRPEARVTVDQRNEGRAALVEQVVGAVTRPMVAPAPPRAPHALLAAPLWGLSHAASFSGRPVQRR